MQEPATVMSGPRKDGSTREEVNRFFLWIDGVGGFLLCLGNRVTLGHAAPDNTVDVPILADVSKHHATLQRDPEGYYLEAVRGVQVNGRAVEKAFLHTGDRLTLGTSCQFLFEQRVPVSASARLNLVSGHRLGRAVDGVLLMAETLVLGPGAQSHVLVPELDQPLILFRQKECLAVRYPGVLHTNGHAQSERCPLTLGQRVMTEHVVFTLDT